MQKITPFLWFNNNAEEAMNFYTSVFSSSPRKSGESKIVKIKYYPEGATEEHLAGMDGKVLTGVFTLEGQEFMALDGGPLFKPNESVSFLVDCATQEEIDYFWDTFTKDGGEESQCGWLKDKYGFSWQIAPPMAQFLATEDIAANARAMAAMMQMKKIDMAALQKAYDGK